MDLVPVQRVTAAQSVAEQIIGEMRRGRLQPGDQLPTERELMQQLGVGRSSVREGLQMLVTLNLVESLRGAGTFVRHPHPSGVFRPDLLGVLIANSAAIELIEARHMIEPPTARLACIRATEGDLNSIAKLLEDHKRALEASDPVNEHAAKFHVLVARASHNHIVASFMESIIGLLMERGRKVGRIPGYATQELAEHAEIARLISNRDPDAAEATMRAHIIASAETYDATGASKAIAESKFGRPPAQSGSPIRHEL